MVGVAREMLRGREGGSGPSEQAVREEKCLHEVPEPVAGGGAHLRDHSHGSGEDLGTDDPGGTVPGDGLWRRKPSSQSP